jgi:dihydroorotate dehydrogenase
VRVYEWVFGALLQRVDAERAHGWSFRALRALVGTPGGERLVRRVCSVPAIPVRALGGEFPSPLGLAAGFDKEAAGIDALAALGFGFIEVGTVTARPQPGNPRPRLFRLAKDRAIVNRMGFNNDGAEAVAARLARRAQIRRAQTRRARARADRTAWPSPRVGVNIGKSKAAPDDRAADDYATSARLLAPYADYLVVNVSSPNTPGLRDLQAVERLRPVLEAVRHAADAAAKRRVPLLVKIAPDLADEDVLAVADLAIELGLDGVVATNTTISRSGLRSDPTGVAQVGAGGLSGAPLKERSLEVLRLLRTHAVEALTLVSVGGVETPEDVEERLRAGATLVQAYTGLIYGGPLWPRRVIRRLAAIRSGGQQ